MMGCVYRLEFASGKSYIGITRQTIVKMRFWRHAADTRNGKQAAVNCAWRKYGEPSFTVLAVVEDHQLADTEIRAIRVYGTRAPDGYNITEGGECPAMAAETRRKLSTIQLGKKRGPLSDETKRRISEANKGKKRTPEQCARIAAGVAGKPRPPCTTEHRRNLSAAKLGKTKAQPPCSDETKKKISAANKGKSIPPEQRARISATLTGRPNIKLRGVSLSVEHRAKLKAAWARRKERNAGHLRFRDAP